MAITKKTLITFVFTIIFIVSSVHCLTTASAVTPDNGFEIKRLICFNLSELCKDAGLVGCGEFCTKWGYYFGLRAKFKGCFEKDKYALSSMY
uniref:Prolamin-like domain-containing protein n=1 Tax=Brassica oleracea TaxID=3712 RepID=A0A3P6CC16_BRAOL|nr:unnamed protein product [Brassica oleracea]